MKNQDKTPVSSFALFTPSKNAFMKNFKTFAVILAPSAIWELFGFIDRFSEPVKTTTTTESNTAMIVTLLVVFFVFIPLLFIIGALSTKLQLESARGNVISFKELWAATKPRILPFVNLSFSVAIRILGGLLLFIVPGLIAFKKYVLSPYILMEDSSLSAAKAMKKSSEMSKNPYMGYVWGVVGVSILLSLIGIIPVFGSIIAFIATSLYSVAMPLRYLELKKLSKN